MTLKEKVTAACEIAETEQEAAEKLRKTMTEQEKQSAWGKHQTHLKNNPKKANVLQVKKSVSAESTLTKGEVWESEKQMLAKFDQTEFDTHIASGRIKWRSDPWSYGVYNYCDQGNVKRKWRVAKGHEASMAKEVEADDDLMETFQDWEGKEQQSQLAEFEASSFFDYFLL